MATASMVYGTPTAMTITLASLASSATAGREGTAVDNTSTLAIRGVTMSSGEDLGVSSATVAETSTADNNFQTNAQIKTLQGQLDEALTTLRTQASKFGSNLSIVQTRQDFSKALINVLQVGSSGLTLADTNEEGANYTALQTRQQLSTQALSLAAQTDQAVLRLFG